MCYQVWLDDFVVRTRPFLPLAADSEYSALPGWALSKSFKARSENSFDLIARGLICCSRQRVSRFLDDFWCPAGPGRAGPPPGRGQGPVGGVFFCPMRGKGKPGEPAAQELIN